MTFFKK
jgi:hypothetical protein